MQNLAYITLIPIAIVGVALCASKGLTFSSVTTSGAEQQVMSLSRPFKVMVSVHYSAIAAVLHLVVVAHVRGHYRFGGQCAATRHRARRPRAATCLLLD